MKNFSPLPRGLFITIFFWFLFGAGIIFSLATGWAYIINHALVRNQTQESLLAHIHIYGNDLTELYEKEGPGAARRFLNRLHRQDPRFGGILLEGSGKGILTPRTEHHGGLQKPGFPYKEILFKESLTHPGKVFFHKGSAMATQKYVTPKGSYFFTAFTRVPPSSGPVPNPLFMTQAGLLVLGALIFCYGLAQHLTRPIRELQQTALKLGTGDLSARAPLSVTQRKDEIGNLGGAFNTMAEQLHHLISHQRGLLRDISHELRSPLARLSIALEIARKNQDPAMGRFFQRIEKEMTLMNTMIGDLLSLSQLEAKALPHAQKNFSVNALLKKLVEDAAFEASQRNIKVNLLLPLEDLEIQGFPQLFASSQENITRNALGYSPEGGTITVSLKKVIQKKGSSSSLLIQISDEGPGVPPEELSKLFTPFYRTDKARTQGKGHVGLGLAIAQRGVQIHGGTIKARNQEGGGLTMETLIPMRKEGKQFPSPPAPEEKA